MAIYRGDTVWVIVGMEFPAQVDIGGEKHHFKMRTQGIQSAIVLDLDMEGNARIDLPFGFKVTIPLGLAHETEAEAVAALGGYKDERDRIAKEGWEAWERSGGGRTS